MAELYQIDNPELGSIVIRLPYAGPAGNSQAGPTGVQFDRFISYEYREDYITPSDAWSFTLAHDELTDSDRAALIEGARVEVSIDGNVQAVGYIDDIHVHGSRNAGSLITVECRSWLSPAIDGHVDPAIRFKASQTLEDLLQGVFEPFGMKVLAVDNVANRNLITGQIYGTPTSKKGKPLKKFVLHQTKPYLNEGAFAFASRVAQRFGLWLRPAADGQTVICATPDFSQPARYAVRLKTDGSQNNNVTDWSVRSSRGDQPSILFGCGFGGGGEWARSTLRAYIVNPLVVSPFTTVQAFIARYPGITQTSVPLPALGSAIASGPIPEAFIRALYLYDCESHDLAELQTYLRRELGLRMRKSLDAKYTIEGHKLGGQPVAIDTMVEVSDDISRIQQPLWVFGRTFKKEAKNVGSVSTLELIRPGSLSLS